MSSIGPISPPPSLPIDPTEGHHGGGGHKGGVKGGKEHQIQIPQGAHGGKEHVQQAPRQQRLEETTEVEEENPLYAVKERNPEEEQKEEQEKQDSEPSTPLDEKEVRKKRRQMRNISRKV